MGRTTEKAGVLWQGVRRGVAASLCAVSLFGMNACGGGGGGGGAAGDTLSSTTTGIEVPSSVQTVPSNNSNKPSGVSKAVSSVRNTLRTSHTDYDHDSFELKISIRAIEQFDIIESILKAVKQTRYEDSSVVNQGPYGAMVSFEEEHGKELEKWIVDSKMIIENNADVNKLHAWIDEDDGGLIKAQMKIFSAPTDTNIYGVWRLDAGFFNASGTQTGSFVARSSVNAAGESVLEINADMAAHEGGSGAREVLQGRLVLLNASGRGIVRFTSWEMMTPTVKVARYSYDANHVIIQVESDPAVVFARATYSDINLNYEVYTSAGENVRKTRNFGMPLRHTETNGTTHWLYYGAWQGRHQLWGPPDVAPNIPEGATLVAVERGNDGQVYTLAKKYQGHLVEKTLVSAALSDIKGEVLQTWVNEGFQLKYTGSQWEKTTDPPMGTTTDGQAYTMANLYNDPMNHKMVMIFKGPQQLAVDSSGNFLGGYVPQLNDLIWVNINQPIFLTYNGTGWVRYTTISWEGWEPAVSNPTAYTFTQDWRYYLNSKGVNYILTVSGGQTTFVLEKELENVIQPGAEAAAMHGRTFTSQDNQTYTFSWNATDSSITLLDSNSVSHTQSIWYMTSTADPTKTYTWNYAEDANQSWNIMVYLKDAQGNWVFLDDPITFAPITIGTKTLNALAFDGHLFGVPDVWRMLEQGNGVLTQDQKDKIVNIPAGTVLTSRDGSTTYLIKPTFGVRILDVVTSGYTVAIDATLTLDSLPAYEDPAIGDKPAITTITVQEGVFVGQ